jgi:hypothetical protein
MFEWLKHGVKLIMCVNCVQYCIYIKERDGRRSF